MTGLSYAASQVRLYDHDRFLTAIFAPEPARQRLFALYAFNLEIAKAREVVTEPLIGRMRLQWWRDTMDTLYAGKPVAHEVAAPLGQTIRDAGLSRGFFDRLIDAREADMEETPFPDFAAFRAYARETAAPLLMLASEALGCSPLPDEAKRSAEIAGTAWAMTGLLRAMPSHAAQHRVMMPMDGIAAVGVDSASLFTLNPDPGLPRLVAEIGKEALGLLGEARRSARLVPPSCRSPLLLVELARLYLGDLRDAGWNPFAAGLRRGRPMAVLNLAWKRAVGRY